MTPDTQFTEAFLTPAQVAARLNISVRSAQEHFYHWPTVKIGKRRKMRESTFRKLFIEKEV
jgi:hypothetical protein